MCVEVGRMKETGESEGVHESWFGEVVEGRESVRVACLGVLQVPSRETGGEKNAESKSCIRI